MTLVDRACGGISTRDAGCYVAAQVVGACLGAVVANVMFSLPAVDWSTTERSSGALWISEVVATAGLLLVIHGCVRGGRADVVAVAVGVWIGGAYFFTSSTSFANPAVTVARTLSDSFAGIAPASAPMFVAMQLAGAVVAYGAHPAAPSGRCATDLLSHPERRPCLTPTPRRPPCCSCACTTPAARRWPSAGSTTSPAGGPSPGPAAPSPAGRSTRRR